MRRIPLLFLIISVLLSTAGCRSRKSTLPSVNEISQEKGIHRQHDNKEKIDGKTVSRILREAERWKGTPYSYGGKTRKGTDCSGFVMTVYLEAAGIKLPRNSAEQQAFCQHIDKKKLRPADLVFFSTSKRGGRVSHVGIYTGDGRFIHASTSRGVIYSRLDEDYYVRHYHSSGRVRGVDGETEAVDYKPLPKEEILPVREDVPTVTIEELIKKQTPVHKESAPEPIVIDSLKLKADTIRAAVRNAF